MPMAEPRSYGLILPPRFRFRGRFFVQEELHEEAELSQEGLGLRTELHRTYVRTYVRICGAQ